MSEVTERQLRAVMAMCDRLKCRLESLAARGVVTLVDDKKKVQRVQVEILDGETEEDVEVFQPQGVSFTPAVGAEVLLLAIGADRSHTVAFGVQDGAKRPKNHPAGTGGLYTDGEFRVFVDAKKIVHVGQEVGEQFIAQAQKTNDVDDETRQRLDDVTTALNTLRQDFTTFTAHTHIVATAMGPATAAPVVPPVPPVPPIQPLLGKSASVAATWSKCS